jgi:hypothetical protein
MATAPVSMADGELVSAGRAIINENFARLWAYVQGRAFVTVGTSADDDYTIAANQAEVAINAAMTAVNGAGGGDVFVKRGTHVIADLIRVPSNVRLKGAGIGITVIRAINSYTPTDSGLYNTYSNMMVVAAANPVQNIGLSNITFDHNCSNIAGLADSGQHQAISIWNATNVRITNCEVKNGIHWSILLMDCDHFWIQSNTISGGASTTYTQNDGIHVRSSQEGFITNNRINTNGSGTSGDDATAVGTGANRGNQDCKNIVITGNTCASQANGIRVFQEGTYATRNITVSDNIVWFAESSGILLNLFNTSGSLLTDITVTDNQIYNFGTNASRAGINVDQDSPFDQIAFNGLKINDNIIRGGVDTTHWGIRMAAKALNVEICGNQLSGLLGVGGIRVGGDSRPVKDIKVCDNIIDFSTAASGAEGIRLLGTERGTVSANIIRGHTTGSTNGISLRGDNTAGTDNNGVPNIETSAWNNVFGNEIYNVANGIIEINEGASPNNNQYSANHFNTVTTNYTILGAACTVVDGTKIDVRGPNITTASAVVGNLHVASNEAQGIDKGGSISLGGFNDDAASAMRVFATLEGRKENGTTGNSSGYLAIKTNNGGTLTERARIHPAGGLSFRMEVEANVAGSGAPNVLTNVETNKVFTNEGVTAQNYHTLPTATAGLVYTFFVQDSDGIRVVAASGDTIRIEGSVSGAAGRIDSTTVGSSVTLVAINSTEWVAIMVTGSWSVT